MLIELFFNWKSETVKYLRMMVDGCMSWKTHSNVLKNKLNKIISFLLFKRCILWIYVKKNYIFHLFKAG